MIEIQSWRSNKEPEIKINISLHKSILLQNIL